VRVVHAKAHREGGDDPCPNSGGVLSVKRGGEVFSSILPRRHPFRACAKAVIMKRRDDTPNRTDDLLARAESQAT